MIERAIVGYDKSINITRIEDPVDDMPELMTNEYDDMPELVTDHELVSDDELEVDNSVNIFLDDIEYVQTRLEFEEIMNEFDL